MPFDDHGSGGLSAARTFYLMRRADLIICQGLEKKLKPSKLTVAQYTVMTILKFRGSSSSAQLARRLGVRPQTMFQVIIELEERKLIKRLQEDSDRRALQATLTEKGLRLLAICETEVDQLEAEIFADFPADRLARLRKDLLKILSRGIDSREETLKTG
jgi:DNA-binding MarR family transcriptional regulator